MDNKLSELSKPVAYKFDHGVMGPGDFKYGTPQMHSTAKDENASPLYSQEYVSALLAELEAKDKRITTLDMRNSELNSRMDRWASDRAESANRIAELEQDELAMRASSRAVHEAQENHINQQQDRIDSLEKKNGDLGRALGAEEKRLATPVRLPNKNDDEFWFDGVFQVAKFDRSVERSISAVGFTFTVEGDE